jgi:hypothetical protein
MDIPLFRKVMALELLQSELLQFTFHEEVVLPNEQSQPTM